MKNVLYLSLFISLFLPIFPVLTQPMSGVETVYVYKPDGTKHCDTNPGVSLDIMAQELVSNGIQIYKQYKSHDGREGIAVCGSPTGSINVYEIGKSDQNKALQLQYQQHDKSWIQPR